VAAPRIEADATANAEPDGSMEPPAESGIPRHRRRKRRREGTSA
jgi:hypothetical protein